jgi:hypothetical protein
MRGDHGFLCLILQLSQLEEDPEAEQPFGKNPFEDDEDEMENELQNGDTVRVTTSRSSKTTKTSANSSRSDGAPVTSASFHDDSDDDLLL